MAAPRAHDDALLVIEVARSGGVAGLTARWAVTCRDAAEVDAWTPLVEACPWDAPAASGAVDSPARDVFVWQLAATGSTTVLPDRRATLPDPQLTGPWRDLADRVRDAAKAARGRG